MTTQETSPQALPKFRGWIQGKTRILAAWIFAGILGFFAREMPALPGVLLSFIGATLRFWASGYLRKDSRPAVGGPYGMVRNPLYLGTYLMAVGTVWSIGNVPLLVVLSVLFAAVYHYIILDEETKLTRIFGEPYAKYCALVPRFFPRPWPVARARLLEINPESAHLLYDWAISTKNKAYEAYAAFAGLWGFTALCAWAWQRFAS